jgi:hypothetical protein
MFKMLSLYGAVHVAASAGIHRPPNIAVRISIHTLAAVRVRVVAGFRVGILVPILLAATLI